MSRHYPVLTSRQLLDFRSCSPRCRRAAAHKTSPVSLRSAGCRMTTLPGLTSSAYNLGAQSRWWPLKAMAGSESGLPPRCTSLCERGRISPPVTGRQPKLSKSQHHVGSVCRVARVTAVSPHQSFAAQPMKIRAKSVLPRDSRLGPKSSFVSARCQQNNFTSTKEMTSIALIGFLLLFQLRPLSASQQLTKDRNKGKPQGLLVDTIAHSTIQYCSHQFLLKLKRPLTGLPECVLLVPLGLGEHRAVVARSLLVPSELLSEDMGFPPSAPIAFSHNPILTVSTFTPV